MDQTPLRRMFIDLCRLYLKPSWDGKDFIKVQKLRAQIITARNNGEIDSDEYKVLHTMESYLLNTMRDTLRKAGELH